MTLEEAIEILEVRIQSKPLLGKHEVYGAIKLGIEALKREKERRRSIYWSGAALLPGETEE
jgi:hypothetical protein